MHTIIALALASSLFGGPITPPPTPSLLTPPTPIELTLASAGIDADALAAAGASPIQARAAMDAAVQGLSPDRDRLLLALARASQEAHRLARTPEARQARARAEEARAALADFDRRTVSLVCSPLDRPIADRVRAVCTARAAHTTRNLPVEHLTAKRSPRDLVLLRDALAASSSSVRLDAEATRARQALLQARRDIMEQWRQVIGQ